MNLVAILRRPATGTQVCELDRAFGALARRLGLGRAAMETVRELASACGVPPSVLLVSEHAFLVALAESERAALLSRQPISDGQRKAIASARHELFAEP